MTDREAVAVPEQAAAAHRQPLALADLVEESRARSVDQPNAAADEQQWARVRKPAALRRSDVDDDPDARLEQLFRGDTIEIGVVDDRDVVGAEPAGQVLRAPVELRGAGELDEARGHGETVDQAGRPRHPAHNRSCGRAY